MSTKQAGPEAQRWYANPEDVARYAEFEGAFMELPRRMFIEVGLRRAGLRPRRILDVGCGTGTGLLELAERVPEAEIVGLDVSPAMVEAARRRVGARARVVEAGVDGLDEPLGPFDLITSHSNLRLWSDPIRGLQTIRDSLARDGVAYVLDLRRDLDPALRERLLAQLPNADFRRLYAAQLDAAYTEAELRDLLARAGVEDYSLRVGPIAGSVRGSFPRARGSQDDRLSQLVGSLAKGGFFAELAQVPMHLFIYP